MKVELIYDPVGPETAVSIDGQPAPREDIYGFLYPVRRCLLQTWLRPTGSWPGLAWQLRELSRGEPVELTFRGRACDFEDVRDALRAEADLTLELRPADPLRAYDPLFAQMDDLLGRLLDEGAAKGDRKTLRDLFPEAAEQIRAARAQDGTQWLRPIRTEADYDAADQAELACCAVEESFLDSYETLDRLARLTRSMRRSQDMICCCIEDPDRRSDFARYAGQFSGFAFRFGTREQCAPAMEEKYGEPYEVRRRLRGYGTAASIVRGCYGRRGSFAERKAELGRKKDPSPGEKQELENCKSALNWFERKEQYLKNLEQLLGGSLL